MCGMGAFLICDRKKFSAVCVKYDNATCKPLNDFGFAPASQVYVPVHPSLQLVV
jgi:hypothetical protein